MCDIATVEIKELKVQYSPAIKSLWVSHTLTGYLWDRNGHVAFLLRGNTVLWIYVKISYLKSINEIISQLRYQWITWSCCVSIYRHYSNILLYIINPIFLELRESKLKFHKVFENPKTKVPKLNSFEYKIIVEQLTVVDGNQMFILSSRHYVSHRQQVGNYRFTVVMPFLYKLRCTVKWSWNSVFLNIVFPPAKRFIYLHNNRVISVLIAGYDRKIFRNKFREFAIEADDAAIVHIYRKQAYH